MKTVKQLSVKLPDEPGMVSKIAEILSDNGVSIVGFGIENTGGSGLLHLVTSDPEKARNVLTTFGHEIQEKDIIAVELPLHPGGLNAVLKSLKESGVNVESLYTFVGLAQRTILLMGLSNVEEGAAALERNWIQLHGSELYSM